MRVAVLGSGGIGGYYAALLARAGHDVFGAAIGRPDDIAQAVLYLASDDAAWTTGTIVTVDGGIMA